MTVITDGKKIADLICNKLKEQIEKEKTKPTLAVILANNNEASKVYVGAKEKKSASIGINSKIYRFDESVTQKEIIDLIQKLNNDNSINAILVQLPLYNHLCADEILEAINPKKDVDGFHPVNIGKLSSNTKPYAIPCTPKGIIKLLKEYNIKIEGKNVVVIGRSNIVGKPASMLFTNENATVTLAHSKTKNLEEITKNADIVVCAVGCPKLIKAEMIKKDAVVIDVGINRGKDNKLTGDVDFENVKEIASCITPVPGGVGPMTIACLMENTYELFKLQNKQEK